MIELLLIPDNFEFLLLKWFNNWENDSLGSSTLIRVDLTGFSNLRSLLTRIIEAFVVYKKFLEFDVVDFRKYNIQ